MTNGSISFSNIKLSFVDKSILEDLISRNTKQENERLKQVFKTDLLMYALGDVFENDREDLQIISGVYNYAQQITHRLMTTRGFHPEDSTLGVPWNDYIGKTYTNKNLTITNLTQDITDELFKDTRTNRVISVKSVFANPNVIDVECTVEPIYVKTPLILGFSVGT